MYNNSVMKKHLFYPFLILLLFLITGLFAIKDYGPSADEHIQIDSGHVIWRYLCLKFNREVPDPIKDAPDLHGFKNSYYGQAATFPTVLLEALRGFTLDSSTIIRIRHYWNFISYFVGLTCFTIAITHLTGDPRRSALWLLLQILLPRIYGDIFYNDRDIMLISWMMIFLASFYLFTRRPGWLTTLLSAAAFGMAVNTRIFGLVLLIFPFLYFVFSDKRKYMLLFLPAAALVWFILSPIAWDDPLHTLPDAFRHFSTQQRFIDTGNEAEVLFFGKHINETRLPWYYIPLYVTATTPLVTLILAFVGIFTVIKKMCKRQFDIRSLFGTGMLIILIAAPLTGIIFHLTFYNGWRHFYFLFLPLSWLSFEGFTLVWNVRKKIIQGAVICCLCVSFFLSITWIIKAHPYQIIYLSPVFREKWIGKFDRDYWILSTTECMKYLLENISNETLNVIDKQALMEYVIIGLKPEERERFHTMYHGQQPIPYEFLIANYSGMLENEASFSYYVPIYAVERDGIKLAEVFQRSHNDELPAADIIESVTTSANPETITAITDSDYQTAWYGNGSETEITFHLNDEYMLNSLEIFPAANASGFPETKIYTSQDGMDWTELSTEAKGSNGTAFPAVKTSWLKLTSDSEYQGIRDILFYGSKANG